MYTEYPVGSRSHLYFLSSDVKTCFLISCTQITCWRLEESEAEGLVQWLKYFPRKHEDQNLIPRTHTEVLGWPMLVILALGSRRQAEPWLSLSSQSSLLGKSQRGETYRRGRVSKYKVRTKRLSQRVKYLPSKHKNLSLIPCIISRHDNVQSKPREVKRDRRIPGACCPASLNNQETPSSKRDKVESLRGRHPTTSGFHNWYTSINMCTTQTPTPKHIHPPHIHTHNFSRN